MKIDTEDIYKINDFQKEKDKFYLLSLIASQEKKKLYSDLNNYIIARCEDDMPCWIWTKDNLNQEAYQNLKNDLENFILNGKTKYTCKKELFEKLRMEYETSDYFEMGYLSCDNLIKPSKIVGTFAKPNSTDKEQLIRYWIDNLKETENIDISEEEAQEEVELWIKGQRLFILIDNNKIVSMAGYSIVGNTAKITHVFTPKEERRKGYCSNLIYELTKKIQDEDLKPILYTDYNYEASNKAYKKLGYIDEGILINFTIVKNNEKFFYEKPSIKRKEEAIEYIQEFIENNSRINGVGGLDKFIDNYEGWLLKLETEKNIEPTEFLVPAETYFFIRESDNKLIGITNIRLFLNKYLREYGGNIGYGIRPSERHQGYNKINLFLALKICDEHKIEKVMLSCDINNIASSKTMKALGAEKEKEIYTEENELDEIYWIDVKKSLNTYRKVYESKILEKR